MSILKGFLDNLASGAGNPKGNLADFQHASRLYVGDAFAFAPKSKFLYHVAFNINPNAAAIIPQLTQKHNNTLNMLVKMVSLPGFKIDADVKHQYNKKRVIQKRIDYDPVQITFHDDNYGVTTALWEAYYRYYYRDGNYAETDPAGNPVTNPAAFQQASRQSSPYNRGNVFAGSQFNKFRYGFDNDSFEPFFNSIVIYQMSRKRYTSFTLVNPMITSWRHDTMDQSVSDPVQSECQVEYETVFYTRGPVSEGTAPKGFATEHYDKTPSPLTLKGGGVTSLMGTGGVLEGGLDVLDDITSGNAFKSPGSLLGTVLRANNVYRNAGNLSSEGLREEGFGILKDAIGSAAGIDVSGVANTFFSNRGGGGAGLLATAAAGGLAYLANRSALREQLTSDSAALDDYTATTTFAKEHLANGGDPDPAATRAAYDALPASEQQRLREDTLSNL